MDINIYLKEVAMKVKLDDCVYVVRWYRTYSEYIKKNPGTSPIRLVDTDCTIELVSGESEFQKAQGKAHQSPRDNHVKSVGRKVALTRALHNLFPLPSHKHIRKRFWDVYLQKCRF